MALKLKLLVVALIFATRLLGQQQGQEGLPGQTGPQKLVWSDEFDRAGAPDTTKWTMDMIPKGRFNNELQRYVAGPENCFVAGGLLHIKALKDGDDITSARLVTRGKGEWLYGRIEARIKLPGGVGVWPAFWMMPAHSAYGGWPRSGEVDIMEYVGYAQDTIHGTIHTMAYNHTRNTQKSSIIHTNNVERDFHIYACAWGPGKIEMFVDGIKYFEFPNDRAGNFATWPFDRPFYIILNLAIGGDWGGRKGVGPGIMPCEMEVDWVRVYQ